MRKLLVYVFACIGLCSQAQVICGGSSATLSASNPSALAGPTYSLLPGPFTSTAGIFVVTPPSTQAYTLYTTGTHTNNQVITTSEVITVTVLPQPLVNPSFTQATCSNSMNAMNLGLYFTPANPVPTYTIAWSTIPGTITSNTQYSVVGGITPGPYQTTIVAQGGCGLIYTFSINPQPAPATFSILPLGSTHTLNCLQSDITFTVTNQNWTYTWTSTSSAPINTYTANLGASNTGTWTVHATNPISGCSETHSFTLIQNTVTPSATVTPLTQNITCTMTGVATVSVFANPTVNITHFIYDPQGGTFPANTPTAVYVPGGVGTFTHCLVNNANGCSDCRTFSVSSTQGYPTFSVVSPQNFTLGCSSKSVAIININNAATQPTAGGPVSYTIIGPPTSTAIPSGTLSNLSNYSITVPGTWTVMVKDNTNNCITSSPISIIQNTFGPSLGAIVPHQILSCTYSTTVLEGLSQSPSVSYNWSFNGSPGNVPGYSVAVSISSAVPTPTLLNSFTLTVTDNNNLCITRSVVPIYQNTYKPLAGITHGGNPAISCLTKTLTLTNLSSSGIPVGSIFPRNLPVIGHLWQGPTPQEPVQLSSTYVGGVPGVYTLTARDLNNGCLGTATVEIRDDQDYPPVTSPKTFTLDCGVLSMKILPNVAGTNTTTAYSYSWTGPPGYTTSVGGYSLSELPTTMIGNYTVSVTNPTNGCQVTVTVGVNKGDLTAEIVPNKTTGFTPLEVTFANNSSTPLSDKDITSIWSFGNGTTRTTTQASVMPIVTYNAPGTYTIVMYANKGACLDSTAVVIDVEAASRITIPNVFTPNKDGVNDLFFVRMDNLNEISAVIIDRWGHKVYELVNSNNGNIEWDGTDQRGNEVAEGTYYYVIKATGKDGQTFDENGTITLIR